MHREKDYFSMAGFNNFELDQDLDLLYKEDGNGNSQDEFPYGIPLENDPTWIGVKTEGRKYTNKNFGIMFIVLQFFVITFGLFGYIKGNAHEVFDTNDYINFKKLWFYSLMQSLWVYRNLIHFTLLISCITGISWLYLLFKYTRQIVYGSIFAGFFTLASVCFSSFRSSGLFGIGLVFLLVGFSILASLYKYRKEIQLTIDIFEESCISLKDNQNLFPITISIVGVYLLYILFWLGGFTRLYSIINSSGNLAWIVRPMQFIMLLGGLWSGVFVANIVSSTVAGSISHWYFTKSPYALPESGDAAINALKRACTTSFGTIALASLLTTTVIFINQSLKRSYKRVKLSSRTYYDVMIFKAIHYLFGSFAGVIKYVSQMAIISNAMYGDNYFESAVHSYRLLGRNKANTVVEGIVGRLVLIWGNMLCTFITLQVLFTSVRFVKGEPIASGAILLCSIFSFSLNYIISKLVGIAADTIFLCYCEDLERNQETHSYLISPELKKSFDFVLSQRRFNNAASRVLHRMTSKNVSDENELNHASNNINTSVFADSDDEHDIFLKGLDNV